MARMELPAEALDWLAVWRDAIYRSTVSAPPVKGE